MDTLKSADVIIADFPGVTGIKRRPAVVISTLDTGSNAEFAIISICLRVEKITPLEWCKSQRR